MGVQGWFLLGGTLMCLPCADSWTRNMLAKPALQQRVRIVKLLDGLRDIDEETLKGMDIDDIVKELRKSNFDELDAGRQRIINEKIFANGLSEGEVRRRILGINGFTIIGFSLAIMILILNTVLGNGWASKLFSNIDEPLPLNSYERMSVDNPENAERIKELRKENVVNYDDMLRQLEQYQAEQNLKPVKE